MDLFKREAERTRAELSSTATTYLQLHASNVWVYERDGFSVDYLRNAQHSGTHPSDHRHQVVVRQSACDLHPSAAQPKLNVGQPCAA
jgi:hypothetical protein